MLFTAESASVLPRCALSDSLQLLVRRPLRYGRPRSRRERVEDGAACLTILGPDGTLPHLRPHKSGLISNEIKRRQLNLSRTVIYNYVK